MNGSTVPHDVKEVLAGFIGAKAMADALTALFAGMSQEQREELARYAIDRTAHSEPMQRAILDALRPHVVAEIAKRVEAMDLPAMVTAAVATSKGRLQAELETATTDALLDGIKSSFTRARYR